MKDAITLAFETIAHHSKSFALASKLLPPSCRAAAAILYAWCRRVDDAVDLAPDAPSALRALERERADLDRVYGGEVPADPLLAAFQQVVRQHQIPERYARELLAGMEMDVRGTVYETLDQLLLYCFRVAGTVGLMMAHLMGVSDRKALASAAHLGIGMQLTNICRDVREDWERGRLYLPAQLVGVRGRDVGVHLLPMDKCRSTVATLLELSERYYRSADGGLKSLSWRCALAVRTARLVYSSIGKVIAARNFDVFRGRAVVSGMTKLALVAQAVGHGALDLLGRRPKFVPVPLPVVEKNDDVIRL